MGESPRLIPCSYVVSGIRMRKTFATAALAAALICSSLPLAAATPSEFYSSLLRRGVAAYDSGRFEEAARHLRYAAFGYVDSIESYQTAQVYLALTHDRLDEQDRAREAVRRVLQAERVERRYARVPVPGPVRTAFEKVAARVLTATELAALRGTGELPPAPPVQSTLRTITTGTATQPVQPPPPVRSTTTTAATQSPVTVNRVEVEVVKPAQTQASSTQPSPAQASSTQQPRPASTQPVQTPQGTQRGTNNNSSNATPVQPRPATTAPVTAQPRPPLTQPATQPVATNTTATRPAYTASEVATRFANAERALTTSSLTEARRIYRELLASANAADHATAVRIAEGFYRARDFAGALAGFERAGTLRRGEEPYRYYVAVALYETGQYERARRELAAALPYIEVTADVERYRLKIQSANQ
ncbi:MAG: hypothetical protein QOJ98_1691 [Acidobacteriota bacterium]|nr:hypothetical protein [Acidobacteriota bacterium]